MMPIATDDATPIASKNAAAPATDVGRLASALLRQAVVAFSVVAPGDRDASLNALDAFIAAPKPATYLAASRALLAARRARALSRFQTAGAARSYARGVELIRRELDPLTASSLAELPVDERAGLRLRALALLVAARRELAEKVAGQAEAMRRQLALGANEPSEKPVRRINRRRARAARTSRSPSKKKT